MSLTENGKQAFLPGIGEHGSFLYAIHNHYLQFCIK